jgi:hypothetical protein
LRDGGRLGGRAGGADDNQHGERQNSSEKP